MDLHSFYISLKSVNHQSYAHSETYIFGAHKKTRDRICKCIMNQFLGSFNVLQIRAQQKQPSFVEQSLGAKNNVFSLSVASSSVQMILLGTKTMSENHVLTFNDFL